MPTAPGPGTTARRPRVALGDEVYLWVLVGLELAITAHLRARFRGAHGGQLVLRRALEGVLLGAALFGGLWLAGELQSPYSDVRLWLSDQLERVKGGTS